MLKLSERALNIQESPIRKLTPIADKVKSKGTHIYHLNIGQPDLPTPKAMFNVFHNFNEEVLAYGPSRGLKNYRENLAGYYNRHDADVTSEDIIVTTAGSEALILAMLTLCSAGDEIIVPEPFYTNYNGFATVTGVKIVPCTTYAEEGFRLPAKEEIEKLVSKKTKAFLICNPGNPTGAVCTREELEMIAEIAVEKDLFIISDEVYREFVYDGEIHTSILNIDSVKNQAVVADSVSKRYNACGARIGCLVSKNPEIIESAMKFAQARLCPPTIDQMAANAVTELGENYFNPIIAEYDKRRNIVFEEVQKIEGAVCRKPKGAFYIMVKLPIDDCEPFVRWLLNEFRIDKETVMVAPGEGFYATPGLGKSELRIAYIIINLR